MANTLFDSTVVIAELRTLSRGSLLIIAERAIELIPAHQLNVLIGDFVKLEATSGQPRKPIQMLLDQAREFFEAAMAGHYYEAVEISNRGRRPQSTGTDAFIAEFDRLMRNCVVASATDIERGTGRSPWREGRASFELLFALLRHIDEGHDDVLAFSDDGSSLDVGVNWRVVLPAYFECLAETEALAPEEFARVVDKVIAEFAEHDRPHFMETAYTAANDAQRTALTSR